MDGSRFIASVIDNSGISNRHAAHLIVEKRFSAGFSFNGRYTFAKSIDNFSADPTRGIFFIGVGPRSERGPSDFDTRHDLSLHADYILPLPFQNGWKRRLARDWTVSAFFNGRSGFPINMNFVRANDFWDEIVRPDLVGGIPVYGHVDGRLSINPAAFRIPPAGTQGTLGRNSLRGLPTSQFDLGLSKRVRFSGESSLLLKMEFINVLNTANLADMQSNLGIQYSSGNLVPNYYVGQSIGTFGGRGFLPFYLYGGPRNIQLSAKFEF